MRHTNSKRLLKAQERFQDAVTKLFESLGARTGQCYDFDLDTPAGLLQVSVFDNWVATRFDDLALARAFTASCGIPCNPYSGKWNHHFTDDEIRSLDSVAQLEYRFERLMSWEAETSHV